MDKLRLLYRRYLHNFVGVSFLTAFLISLFIETISRPGVAGGIGFAFTEPLVFFVNVLIIFACISCAMLFRHKMFAFTIVSALWLILGTINGLVLNNRMTPFTTYDIFELKDGLSLATNYFSKMQIVLIILGIVTLLIAIIILFRKLPKSEEKVVYREVVPILFIILIITGSLLGISIKTKVLDTYFPNLAYGYEENGFSYCFLATWLDKGVSKPRDYSAEKIAGIFNEEDLESTVPAREMNAPEKSPNIVFLQLESFMDPETVDGITLSQDAIPYYRELMKNYSSGRLQVPSVGAGTANTEFESMTGMSVKFFGPGEYPYKSVLLEETCESIPFAMKEQGYSTHAIHNHRGVFYERNRVFANLGFDTYTSIEYMNNVSKTPKNWARDFVLTDQITDALDSTEGKDYIYTISVQGHGKYPTKEVIKDPKIEVTKAPTEELTWSWEYYVNQINEMDYFIKELTETLESYDEDVILVMYGDHLPALDNLTEGNLKEERNVYQTDYIIWSNFQMEKEDKNLYAYQLGAETLNRVGIHNGSFVTYHQKYQKSKSYLEDLKELQYDILYGKKYLYGGENIFSATALKMGVKDIKIEKIVEIGGKYYIKGQNFTEYSKVNLDGEILKTVYLGPTILGLKEENIEINDVSRMKVSQVESKKEILSTSE